MEIRCPHCGAVLPAESVNIQRMAAQCTACNQVFNFADQLGGGADPGHKASGGHHEGALGPRRVDAGSGHEPAASRPEGDAHHEGDAARPQGARAPVAAPPEVKAEGDLVTLTHPWLRGSGLFLALVTLLWAFGLSVWLQDFKWSLNPADLVGPAVHMTVMLVLGYLTVATWVNHTTLTLGRGRLTLHSGPLPWSGAQSWPLDQVAGFETREVCSKKGRVRYYELGARLRSGALASLLRVEGPAAADYLNSRL